MDFDKIEQRSVIKFLILEKNAPKEIYERLVAVYGESAASYSTVKEWSSRFKQGRLSLEDDRRSGCPISAVTEENIMKVEQMLMKNRRLKALEIATDLGISKQSVLTIVHDKLCMSKVSSRWVPRMLTPLHKQARSEMSQLNLDIIYEDSELFFSRIVTGDETWIYHWDPETKQESMQWKHAASPPPRKFKTQPSAGKMMATVFWDTEGVLLVEYMPNKTTITGASYAETLTNLRRAIKEKRRGKLARGVLLLHDNAPVHTSRIAKAAVNNNGFVELSHPPYSPDLAPSDFYLFPNLKKSLRGRRFANDEALKDAVHMFFEAQDKTFYLTGLELLKSRYEKCIDLRGDYVEKQ